MGVSVVDGRTTYTTHWSCMLMLSDSSSTPEQVQELLYSFKILSVVQNFLVLVTFVLHYLELEAVRGWLHKSLYAIVKSLKQRNFRS